MAMALGYRSSSRVEGRQIGIGLGMRVGKSWIWIWDMGMDMARDSAIRVTALAPIRRGGLRS